MNDQSRVITDLLTIELAERAGSTATALRALPREPWIQCGEKNGSPGLIRTGGRPINSRMLYR